MDDRFYFKKGTFYLLILFYLCSSCESNVVETINKTKTQFPNGKRIEVQKINQERTSIGMITGHNYGTTHNFTYSFTTNPGNIFWDGGSGEPKEILFCKDTTYIRYLKKKQLSVPNEQQEKDTIVTYRYYDETQEVFEKHIDNRYFFKLFGEDYWVEISPEDYPTGTSNCEEFSIPNDGELSIMPIAPNLVKE